ncbi:acyltransferase [Lentzea sp. NBRC 105346]|nr:acyltransferase [Lentzea sp. NBRC 105346]
MLLHHATQTSISSHPQLGAPPFVFPLSMGASTLMVISAFFACASLQSGKPGQFLRKRLARLVPAYLVAVLLTFAVQRWIAPEGWSQLDGRDLVYNLLLINQWFPDIDTVDFAYWTVPVQIGAFVAGALLIKVLRNRPLRAFLWALIVTPMLLSPLVNHAEWLFRFYNGVALHRAQLFAAGIAIFLWSRRRMSTKHLVALLAAAVVAQEFHTSETASTVGFAVLLAVVCLAAKGPDWGRSRLVTWLAGISYGVYLVHEQIGTVVMDRLAAHGFGPWSLLAGFITSAVVLGWLLTKYVERPAYRLLTQPQAGRSGTSPRRPAPSVRPVSQPSTSAPDPMTDVLAGPLSVQLR